VVGGGYIGLEMGYVYASLGSRVIVAEMAPTLLPGFDGDLVRPLQLRLSKLFDRIHTGAEVVSVKASSNGISAVISNLPDTNSGEMFDRVLVGGELERRSYCPPKHLAADWIHNNLLGYKILGVFRIRK